MGIVFLGVGRLRRKDEKRGEEKRVKRGIGLQIVIYLQLLPCLLGILLLIDKPHLYLTPR